MPPVGELDDSSLIVDIIEVFVGIFVIIDDEWAAETIEVLDTKLGVIPESTSLTSDQRHLVCEAGVGSNRTLSNKGSAFIEVVGGVEEDAVEVEGSTATHGGIGQLVVDRNFQRVALLSDNGRSGIGSVGENSGTLETIGGNVAVGDVQGDIDHLTVDG